MKTDWKPHLTEEDALGLKDAEKSSFEHLKVITQSQKEKTDIDNEGTKAEKPRANDMELDCPLARIVTSAIQVISKPN